MNKILREDLPHKNNKVDWSNANNCIVRFIYKDIYGELKILNSTRSGHNRMLLIEYQEKTFTISSSSFLDARLNYIVGNVTKEYVYNVGDIINGKHSDLLILEQTRIKYKNGSSKGYKYICLKCKQENTATENWLKKGVGCPICCPSPQKVIKGINDIATTNPELVKYFANIDDVYTHNYSSSLKVWFKCLDCGFEKEMRIDTFYKYGFNCSKCGDKISLPNKIGFGILEQLLLNNFQTEYSPEWIKPKRYDFYFILNNKEYILEMDGGFHNKDNPMSGQTKEESKFIDDYKDSLANEHGIEVIRIDCNPSEFEYIKQNILNNKRLNELFDLSKVDWFKMLEFISSTRIKEACDLWNIGIHSTTEIGMIMKISNVTILKYLKIGVQINWCDYTNQNYIKSSEKNKNIYHKEIICLDNGLVFKGGTECARKSVEIFGVQLFKENISINLKGKRPHHKGFHFKYISDLTPEEYIKYDIENKLKQLRKDLI